MAKNWLPSSTWHVRCRSPPVSLWSRWACDTYIAACLEETGEPAPDVQARLIFLSHLVERPFLSHQVPQDQFRCSTRQGIERELPLRVAEGEQMGKLTPSE